MAVNDKQKTAIIDNDTNLKTTIDTRLAQGFVIEFMLSLEPTQKKILIVYATPETI